MSRVFNPAFLKTSILEMDDVLKNPLLLQTCRNLSADSEYSGMNKFLTMYSKEVPLRSIDAVGIFAHYLDIPVGWLLFSYENDFVCFKAGPGKAVTHVYVHHQWRNLGIGTRLQLMAAKMASPDTVYVYRHEEPRFFDPIMKTHKNLTAII